MRTKFFRDLMRKFVTYSLKKDIFLIEWQQQHPPPPKAGCAGGEGGNAATLYCPESVFPVPGTHAIMTTCKQCPNTQDRPWM